MPHDIPLARLRAAHKRYGAAPALAGVDLDIPAGQVLALLGPNGAGKSTAIGLLLGLLRADAGTVELFGEKPGSLAVRRRIGVMLQSASLPETLKVRELIALTRSYYPDPLDLQECAHQAGVADLLDRYCGALSGGQQRRVQFALAICGQPDLLFLDEPTTGLDIEARRAIWVAVRARLAQGSAVLLTTHYLEEAEALADHVAVLVGGRIAAQGSVAQISASAGQRRIRCVSALAPETIAAWPGVHEVGRTETHLEILAGNTEAVVLQLLQRDPSLTGLEIERAGLAEAFLHLTCDADEKEAA